MQIERVELLVNLRAGDLKYTKGQVFVPPLPEVIQTEVALKNRTVRVYERKVDAPAPPSTDKEKMIAPAPTDDEIVGGGEAAANESQKASGKDGGGPSRVAATKESRQKPTMVRRRTAGAKG